MDAEFYTNNRNNLTTKLNGGLVILSAYGRVQRTNDSAHSFQQEANFWYLCGITEPDWILILDGMQQTSWLVMPKISDTHLIFDGGIDAQAAKVVSGVDKVISSDESISLLRTLAKRHSVVHTVGQPLHADSFNFSLNPSILKNQQMLERTFERVQDCRLELAKLRAIKQPVELVALRKAIAITSAAFEHVHSNIKEYSYEHEIEADFSYHFRRSGAEGHAYDPIVASGHNACTLHYGYNNSKISSRDLVLMDVGASYQRYSADITRTYAKGTASKRQIDVHKAVESAHKQIISLLEPHLSVEKYQSSVDEIMVDAIKNLGLYKNEESLRRYFPHAVSHGLGIDVHDSLGGPKFFEENMVITVEPGIYIPEESIGVRIEDDILITPGGRKVLSGSLSTGL